MRIRTPDESSLIELYNSIARERTILGRQTYGLMLSSWQGHIADTLVDFICAHISSTSLIIGPDEDIRDYIVSLDLQTLVWGLVCSIWTNGFNYYRSCVALPKNEDETKCTHQINEKICVDNLQIIDKSQMTDWQIRHMSERATGKMTVESVKRYREEFLKGKEKRVRISEELEMVISLPNINEYNLSSRRVVDDLEEKYGRAMTVDENKRNQALLMHGNANACRQYEHMVKQIIINDDIVLDTQEEVSNALIDLSAADEARETFFKEIKNYIDDSTISLICIPNYECPACKQPQQLPDENIKYPDFIPIDVIYIFFILAPQRITKAATRA